MSAAVFVIAWCVGAVAFVAWRFRAEMRRTHQPAVKPRPVPVDLDAEDRRHGGAVPVAAWSADGHVTDDAADFFTWDAEMKGSQS